MATSYAWAFRTSLRRNAFGWRGTRKAIERLNEAVGEIERMARTSDTLALQGSEAGRAWSILIGDSGDATFTASAADGATVIFAACTLR